MTKAGWPAWGRDIMRTQLLMVGSATCLVAAGLAPVVAAAPSPAPACRMLVDPAGDVNDRSNPAKAPQLDEPAADLVSADVASNRSHLTVAVRPRAFHPERTTAVYYQVFLRVDEAPYRFEYLRDVRGTTYTVWHVLSRDVYAGDAVAVPGATGTEDVARGEVRVSIPLGALARYGPVRPGTLVRGLGVWTNRTIPNVVAYVVDEGYTMRTYRLGQPSCVPVGR